MRKNHTDRRVCQWGLGLLSLTGWALGWAAAPTSAAVPSNRLPTSVSTASWGLALEDNRPPAEPNTVPAGDPATTGGPPPTDKQTPLEDLIRDDSTLPTAGLVGRFLLAMGFVGALAVAAFYLSKRVNPRAVRSRSKELAVLETVMLGNRRALHLVGIGPGRRILIGSTADRITYLADVSDTAAAESDLDVSTGIPTGSDGPSFGMSPTESAQPPSREGHER